MRKIQWLCDIKSHCTRQQYLRKFYKLIGYGSTAQVMDSFIGGITFCSMRKYFFFKKDSKNVAVILGLKYCGLDGETTICTLFNYILSRFLRRILAVCAEI